MTTSTPADLPEHDNALQPGVRLEEFEIRGVVGVGGFGIVYRAFDHDLEREVAIKEYMPGQLAGRDVTGAVTVRARTHVETFGIGMRSFINEARLLARFDHPALLKVYRYWEANGTAYMAMPFYDGHTLSHVVRGMPMPPSQDWLMGVIEPLLGALEQLHGQQIYHRDISPDNILLLSDGHPVLLDFGAARRVIGDRTQNLTAILKPNYAPIEQYADVAGLRQGPWTDLYALGALVYGCLTGHPPSPAATRAVMDDLIPLAQLGRQLHEHHGLSYSPAFLAAWQATLAVRPAERPQSVAELRAALHGQGAADPGRPTPRTAPTVPRPTTPPPTASRPAAAADELDADRTVIRPPPPQPPPPRRAAPPRTSTDDPDQADPDRTVIRPPAVPAPPRSQPPAPAPVRQATPPPSPGVPPVPPVPVRQVAPQSRTPPAAGPSRGLLAALGVLGLLVGGGVFLVTRGGEPGTPAAPVALAVSAPAAAPAEPASASPTPEVAPVPIASAPVSETPASALQPESEPAAASKPPLPAVQPLPAPPVATSARKAQTAASVPAGRAAATAGAASATRPPAHVIRPGVAISPPAPPSAPIPAPVGPATATEACGSKVFIALWNCMERECKNPRYAGQKDCELYVKEKGPQQ